MKNDHTVDSDGVSGAPETSGESKTTAVATTQRGTRVRRRATLPAVPGSDPNPGEPPLTPRSTTENDARLREGKPPHWA